MTEVITIEGVTIKTPSKFSISRYNITKSSRNAKGKMKMALMAKKRKFFFEYETISSTDLTTILNIIDGTNMFMNLTYYENNVQKSARVYVGEIPLELLRTGNVWYWQNVKFELIEQ
jgi:hypothetical protein